MNTLEAGILETTVRIRSFDADFRHRATTDALCRYFLDAAWAHAEALGVGFRALSDQGRLWVLSRLRMELERPPVWGETLRVRTWPRAARTIFAMRDFEMLDEAGKRAVAGSSAWVVVDGVTRRPQRIERVVSGVQPVERAALSGDPEKVPELACGQVVLTAPVRYLDIDVNRHVTSARYIGWMLDSYPVEFHVAHQLAWLELNYVGETRESDTVTVRAETAAAGGHLHVISRGDGEPVCRARLGWIQAA